MASLMQRESSFCDKDQNDSLVRTLYDQKQSSTFCDVVMKVCGRDIYAHSNVLAAASPYFNHFLAQDLPRQFSQRAPQVIEIQIDGSEPNMMYEEAVSLVIDFIYTGKLTVRENNAAQVTEIARIMQMDNIVKFCEDFIAGKTPDGTTFVNSETSRYMESGVNTEKSFDVNQTVQLVDYVTSIQEPAVMQHSKIKASKLVSVSTQVMPQLLGLKCEVFPTKDVSTSTDRRYFEQALCAETSHFTVKRGPGRKPNYLKKLELELSKADSVSIPTKQLAGKSPANKHATPDGSKTTTLKKEILVSENTDSQSNESNLSKAGNLQKHQILRTELTASQDPVGLQKLKAGVPDNGSKDSNSAEDEAYPNLSLSGSSECKESPKKRKRTNSNLAKTSPEKLDTNELVGLTTRSGKKLVKQEGIANQEESEGEIMDLPTTSEHQSPLKQESELEEGEIDYTGACHDEDEDGVEEEEGAEDGEVTGTKRPKEVEEDQLPVKRKRRKKEFPGYDSYYSSIIVSPKKYSCSTCDFTTNKVREMSSHNKLHKLEQNTCFYCEQRFEDHDVLTKHIEKHKGPRPFFCSVCDLRFKTRTQLNLHLPKHSDDKPFICEICSQGFKWKHALKSHMVTHSHKKDHLCDICGYATAHKSQLKAHKLIHTGQTFRCEFPECSFQATKLQNMKYHMLTHTREKPHQCEVCGQSFSLVKNMRRHMLLHSADKSFKCLQCDFASTRYDKLKEHQLKLHGFGTPPEKRVRISDMVEANQSMVTLEGRLFLDAEQYVPKSEALETDPTITILNPPPVEISREEIESSMQILPNQTIIIAQADISGELTSEQMADVSVSLPSDETGVIQGHTIPIVEGSIVQGEESYPIHYTEVMIPSSHVNVENLVQTVYVSSHPSELVAVEEQEV